MQQTVIIKFGGSVITDKSQSVPTLRSKVIQQLAKQISQLCLSGKNKIILVHGAGSFGHPIAKRYQLHKGMTMDEQKFAFCSIQRWVTKLNLAIINSLLQEKVPVVSFSPRSFITTSAGVLKNFDYSLIERCLELRQVPILFGDAVFDDKWNCSILSGDTIIGYLAKKLKAAQVVFLSDVDGIFNSNPKRNPQAKLISKVTNKNLGQVLKGISNHHEHDVTGEMSGKILAIKNHLANINVLIANGLRPQILVKALINQEPVGTKLLLGSNLDQVNQRPPRE